MCVYVVFERNTTQEKKELCCDQRHYAHVYVYIMSMEKKLCCDQRHYTHIYVILVYGCNIAAGRIPFIIGSWTSEIHRQNYQEFIVRNAQKVLNRKYVEK